jgi:hypothetical protein
MESLFSHLIAGLIGAGIVWFLDRSPKRQFKMMLDAIADGKVEGKDWRFVRDAEGRPTGFRLMYGASAETDKPGSI